MYNASTNKEPVKRRRLWSFKESKRLVHVRDPDCAKVRNVLNLILREKLAASVLSDTSNPVLSLLRE